MARIIRMATRRTYLPPRQLGIRPRQLHHVALGEVQRAAEAGGRRRQAKVLLTRLHLGKPWAMHVNDGGDAFCTQVR